MAKFECPKIYKKCNFIVFAQKNHKTFGSLRENLQEFKLMER